MWIMKTQKHGKILAIGLLSLIVLAGLSIGASNGVSASGSPKGQIVNLLYSHQQNKVYINFSSKNIGTASGVIWTKITAVGPVYSYSQTLAVGASYKNAFAGSYQGYTYLIQVGHGSTVDDSKYVKP